MRILIDYIRSLFCTHDWELIFDTHIRYIDTGETTRCQTYRCRKCGYAKKYKAT